MYNIKLFKNEKIVDIIIFVHRFYQGNEMAFLHYYARQKGYRDFYDLYVWSWCENQNEHEWIVRMFYRYIGIR